MTVKYTAHDTANVTLTTTSETVVATVGGINTPRRTTVTIEAWAQLTTGTGTTTVTPRIRRGTTTGGPLVDEGNAVTIGAAAGGTENFSITAQDEGVDLAGESYVLTLQQAGATGNGTALQAGISAEMPD